MSISIPSPNSTNKPRASLALGPLLFEFSRLLSIVPAVFGTLWNVYHTIQPPHESWCWAAEYAVCVLWSVLTGWQCLQLTTGLFKRWRVYYSPLPTLIRLFALQAICWPATHLTLTLLGHEVRPLICWAAIGTTTCCSRSVQMWVTSNIVEPPHAQQNGAASPELKRRYRRRWDWNAVLRECAFPAGVVYFLMAWVLALRTEFGGCPPAS
ncbi:N-glycosylation protein-domain-containing protein [Phanerochaete sordida]|uniref:N-glycosylation protein-domain-containing protein n=1 Tax=Phanerochaete sordida TaxID=48140 RepID=A0A9P3GJA2_9APHY|nr:N-glycosylation protein-domain-containing protein [Phanerochaete sordida]